MYSSEARKKEQPSCSCRLTRNEWLRGLLRLFPSGSVTLHRSPGNTTATFTFLLRKPFRYLNNCSSSFTPASCCWEFQKTIDGFKTPRPNSAPQKLFENPRDTSAEAFVSTAASRGPKPTPQILPSAAGGALPRLLFPQKLSFLESWSSV